MTGPVSPEPPPVIARLRAAWNARDLAALQACFHPNYESRQPLHPDRAFRGREGLARCWGMLLEAVPDFQAELLGCAAAGDVVWTEWRWTGSPLGGGAFTAGGVMIFGLEADQIAWARIYTETVQVQGPDFDAILDEILRCAPAPDAA